jgi:hypothetical protein
MIPAAIKALSCLIAILLFLVPIPSNAECPDLPARLRHHPRIIGQWLAFTSDWQASRLRLSSAYRHFAPWSHLSHDGIEEVSTA